MSAPAVLVVGAGPAGLSAARELGRSGVGPVLVVDREPEPGGVPRHCGHSGFGLQDLRRSLSGPAYAAVLTRRAEESGAEVRAGITVAGMSDGVVTLIGPGGIEDVRPSVVLLATGARERPRSARLVPGDRPAGVFTTGQLQQWVAAGLPVGTRAVVVGAEHVGYSALLTLRHAGVRAVAMVTELPHHQTVAAFALAARVGLRVPLRTGTRVVGLRGHGRLEAVDVEDIRTGSVDRIGADTVVFTGDWIPDHELCRRIGLAGDEGTLGPRTDGWGRTSRAGVLAAGNLVHPGETAGIAALGGRAVGRRLAGSWDDRPRPGAPHLLGGLQVVATSPLTWVVPSVVDPSDPPDRLLLRSSSFSRQRLVEVSQSGTVIGRHRLRHVTPNRSLGVPGSVVAAARPGGGALVMSLH